MRISAFLLAVLFASCAATYSAGVRRKAETLNAWCVTDDGPIHPCYSRTQAFCADAGLEKTCGDAFNWSIK